MLFYLFISLITAIPKFTYLLADRNAKCKEVRNDLINYFRDGIFDDPKFTENQATEISNAFLDCICVKDDVNDALEDVDDDTELLFISAGKINYVDDDENIFDFDELPRKMIVHISSIDQKLFSNEKSNYAVSQISNMAKNMLSISYDAKSQSKNIELSQLLSKKTSSHRKGSSNGNMIKIEGDMKKKVSFLAVFEQDNLIFDSDLNCEYVYLYECNLNAADKPIKITSQVNLLIDSMTYKSLYKLYQSNNIKISVNQFGLIMEKMTTVRLSFSPIDSTFQFSDKSYPTQADQYKDAIYPQVPLSWFKTITVLSTSTQYSLYLNNDFNPKKDTLPGINISINDPHINPLSFNAKEEVDIRTESSNPGAWDQFSSKPNIIVDCDPNKFSVNAPNNIQVEQVNHNDNNNQNNKNNKKKLIIIIVSVCVAVVVIIVIIVVVVVCRNKYQSHIVYIADDHHHSATGQGSNKLNEQMSNGFTDNLDDKKDEKELSDQDLEKEKESGNNLSIGSNNQSNNSFASSHPAVQYPQPGDSHPGYPQQANSTGSANNLPTDQPNSAYAVPF